MAKDPISLVYDLPGKLGRAFEDNISREEYVFVKLCTAMGEAIVVTDRRVLIIKAGSITGAGLFAARAKTFLFTDISSVDLRLGVMGGHLQISVAGTVEIRDAAYLDMSRAENSVTFTAPFKETMKIVADFIRQRAAEARRPAQPATNTGDLVSEVKKLVDLRKEGYLTDAEFEAAKKKLLGV